MGNMTTAIKKLELINPIFAAHHFICEPLEEDCVWYELAFDGFDGIGNVDEDGRKFHYIVTADPNPWNCCQAYAYGFSWFVDKVYDDDDYMPDLSDTELVSIIDYMMERIKEDRKNH